jgi:hypothetical protein
MHTIALDEDKAQLVVDRDELLILNAALNEVCNGIAVFEFETRIGANRDLVVSLLKELSLLIDKMGPASEQTSPTE